jgi:hypothetical protein
MIMLEFIQALSTATSRRNHHLLLAAGDDSGLRDIRELVGSAGGRIRTRDHLAA